MNPIPFDDQQPQAGFAPRRQYENLSGAPIAGDVEALANGQVVPLSGVAAAAAQHQPKVQILPRPKSKKDKIADLAAATTKLSIEDSLKLTDANGMAMKTPVSILQELLSRRGITPSYELVQIEGAIHEPTFRYRVSFNDKEVPFTAMGAGRSKKEAKHSAARALIDKLTGVQLPEPPSASPSGAAVAAEGTSDGNANAVGSGDGTDKIVGNPIGWLQEMCMSRRWPPPTYETETEVGLPHERLFTIACTILNFREVGKGKSKKIAKRLAAHKMWTRLQENPLDKAQITESMRSEMDGDKTCLKGPKIDYVKLLSDIANENQFEVTYVDIEEKTFNNLCQCLVQLSTLPVGVCHGSGETAADAQRQSAQNALEYLKIMTKK